MTRSLLAVLFAVFTLSALNGAGRRHADDGFIQDPRMYGAYNAWGQQDSSAKLAEYRRLMTELRAIASQVGLSDVKPQLEVNGTPVFKADGKTPVLNEDFETPYEMVVNGLQKDLTKLTGLTETQVVNEAKRRLQAERDRFTALIRSADRTVTDRQKDRARHQLAIVNKQFAEINTAGAEKRRTYVNYAKKELLRAINERRELLKSGVPESVRRKAEEELEKIQERYESTVKSDDQSPYLSALAHLFIKDLGPNFRLPAKAGIETVIGMGLMATTVKPVIEQLTEVSRNMSAEMRSWTEKRFAALLRWFKIGNSFTMKDTTRWSQTVKTVIDTLKVAAKAMTSASATKHALGARDIKALQGAAETQETKQEFLLGAANIRKLKRLRDEVMVKKAFYLSEESRRHKLAQDTLILVNYFDDAIENLGLLMTLIHGANGVEGLSDAVCAAEIEGIGEATISTFGDLRALIDPNAEAATTAKSSYGYSGYAGQSAAYAGQYGTTAY